MESQSDASSAGMKYQDTLPQQYPMITPPACSASVGNQDGYTDQDVQSVLSLAEDTNEATKYVDRLIADLRFLRNSGECWAKKCAKS